MVSHMYPRELQFNKANSFDSEALFYLDLSITVGIVSSKKKIKKRNDFNFEIVNFPMIISKI